MHNLHNTLDEITATRSQIAGGGVSRPRPSGAVPDAAAADLAGVSRCRPAARGRSMSS
jgi:hypothetical protein